jgi:hypothetical protein
MQHEAKNDLMCRLEDGPVSFEMATNGIFLFEQSGFSARLSIRSDGSTELTLNGDSVIVADTPDLAKSHAETLYAAHLSGSEDTLLPHVATDGASLGA